MPETLVGDAEDFEDGDRTVIAVGDREIGVFRYDGGFVAYENRCLHQGGPACEGVLIGKVEAVLAEDRSVVGERFAEGVTHFVCPWHGWEYDLATGECVGDRRRRLKRFKVIERDGRVYVIS
jgi:nitrite reductase/ring-hydroxylating ferredoxin subunit